jgi:hypothetical protein
MTCAAVTGTVTFYDRQGALAAIALAEKRAFRSFGKCIPIAFHVHSTCTPCASHGHSTPRAPGCKVLKEPFVADTAPSSTCCACAPLYAGSPPPYTCLKQARRPRTLSTHKQARRPHTLANKQARRPHTLAQAGSPPPYTCLWFCSLARSLALGVSQIDPSVESPTSTRSNLLH